MIDQPIKYSALVGVFFLILFTAYSSFSNIITQIYQQQGNPILGPIMLASTYVAFMISSIFAPTFVWQYKTQMCIAALLYSISFSTGLFITYLPKLMMYIVTILGGFCCGLGAALIWTSLGGYLHLLCHKYYVLQDKGKYFGIFSGIYCIKGVVGALITTFCLGYFSNIIYFKIITAIGFLSCLFCLMFVNNVQENTPIIQKQFNIFRAIDKMLKFCPKMKYCFPLIFLDGLILSISNVSLTHLISPSETKQDTNFRIGICFVCFGFGSIFGGYLSGYLNDIFTIKNSGYIGLYLVMLTCFLGYLGLQLQYYALICALFYFWGFAFFYIDGWLLIICSKIFQGALESFAITKQAQSISFILYQIFVIVTLNKISLGYILGFVLLLIIPVAYSINKLFEISMEHKVFELQQVNDDK